MELNKLMLEIVYLNNWDRVLEEPWYLDVGHELSKRVSLYLPKPKTKTIDELIDEGYKLDGKN